MSFLSLGFLDLGAASADIALSSVFSESDSAFSDAEHNSLMSSIPRDRLGVGSSFLSIVRSLGLSIGVATASAIVSSRLVAVTGQTSLDG